MISDEINLQFDDLLDFIKSHRLRVFNIMLAHHKFLHEHSQFPLILDKDRLINTQSTQNFLLLRNSQILNFFHPIGNEIHIFTHIVSPICFIISPSFFFEFFRIHQNFLL
eukprot:TRINITY_DN11893_c0_g1_i1.p1 TRINITY_DN11893_c0_g1~~TRINITY_DN11893_c0_g1_i1.p1  ORF type:complete len:110 (+),score=4.13 TRINITY_DN11893_c0_g1_i1:343-672(+)